MSTPPPHPTPLRESMASPRRTRGTRYVPCSPGILTFDGEGRPRDHDAAAIIGLVPFGSLTASTRRHRHVPAGPSPPLVGRAGSHCIASSRSGWLVRDRGFGQHYPAFIGTSRSCLMRGLDG